MTMALVTSATGLVGSDVLAAVLTNSRVGAVLAVGRRLVEE